MPNDFYTKTGSPSTGSTGSSSVIRGEFDSIEDGFDKLPALNNTGNQAVFVNAGGTALESVNNTTARARIGAQAQDADLDALAALDATVGFVVRAAAATFNRNVITGTANEITVTNGNGVAGNATISLPTALTYTGKTVQGGTFNNAAITSATQVSTSNAAITGGTVNNVTANGGTYNNVAITNSPNISTIGDVTIGGASIPQNPQNAGYTLVAADANKHISFQTAGTFTIPANASVPYAIGTVVTFFNPSGSNCSIAITSDTLTLAGVGTTGTRTLANHGIATALKVTANIWYISGTGLS